MQNLMPETRALIDDYGIISLLTDNLMKLQDSHPDLERFVGWNSTSYRRAVEDFLPSGVKNIMTDAPYRYSFYKEIAQIDGLFVFHNRTYPALVQMVDNGNQCVLTLEFCKHMFHKIENNANAVNELASLLKANRQPLWFNVPMVPQADTAAQRRAIFHAIEILLEKNPRRLPTFARDAIHEMGYDRKTVSAKEITALLKEIIEEEKNGSAS